VSIGNRLEDVFRALAPADLAGLIDFRTGRASESVTSLLIETFLITPPGGVLSTQDVKDRVDQLANRATAQQRSELQQLLRIYTSVGYPQYASREQKRDRQNNNQLVD
jgi:hypothetical protein